MKNTFTVLLVAAMATFSLYANDPFEFITDDGHSYIKINSELAEFGFIVTCNSSANNKIGVIYSNVNGDDINLGMSNAYRITDLTKDDTLKFYVNGIDNIIAYDIVKNGDNTYTLTVAESNKSLTGGMNHGYSQGKHKGNGYGHNNGNNFNHGNGSNVLNDGDDVWFKIGEMTYSMKEQSPTGMPLPGFKISMLLSVTMAVTILLFKRSLHFWR